MSLRAEYALGNSPYNAFLFAAVGEERAGQPLTVLSALARLGFDPWTEAARLAALPREAAARAFAVSIAMLPEGDWKASDSDAIATRLVGSLPKPGEAIPSPPKPAAPRAAALRDGAHPALDQITALYRRPLFWAALAIAGLLLVWQVQPDATFEWPQSSSTSSRR
jgi:hypothetical protein